MKFTILGQPHSKNKHATMVIRGKAILYVKPKAKAYTLSVRTQVMSLKPLEGPVSFTATLYYKTEIPDLEESVLIDALQGFAYKNDRQVREKHIFHAIDKENPRAEIEVVEL